MYWLGVLLLTLLAAAASAQSGKTLAVKPATGPLAGRTLYTNSHALLVGVSRYAHLPSDKRLQFADKDALAMREVLVRSYGFPAENITLLLNEEATKSAIETALSTFADPRKVAKDDRLLLYFSGHGQTVTLPDASEMGFLIPHDAKVDLQAPNNAAPYLSTCVEMEGLWKYLRGCPAKHALVLTDACFSGLLVQARALGDREKLNSNELAKQASRPARQVLTAGGKGEEAFEDPKLGHGAFTYKLLEELRAEAAVTGEVFTVTDLAATLKRGVSNLTDGKQSPVFGSYRTEGDFLFVTTPEQPVPSLPANRVVVRPQVEMPSNADPKLGTVKINPRDGAEMVWVPAGEFQMGRSDGRDNEKPVHPVRISKGFWIYRTEITNAQYRKFCVATKRKLPLDTGWEPLDSLPVVNVSWEDAQAYCRWAGARLPTEAEWEYAARGPENNLYPWGNAKPTPQLAVFMEKRYGEAPLAVDSFPAGKSWCGALHMCGNVWEWSADWYSETYYQSSPAVDPAGPATGFTRVARGGSRDSHDFQLPSAYRLPTYTIKAMHDIGFRPAMTQ